MKNEQIYDDKPGAIFVFCLLDALHMVEEFTLGFVEWANEYFGSFDWTQNIIGNAICKDISPGQVIFVGINDRTKTFLHGEYL